MIGCCRLRKGWSFNPQRVYGSIIGLYPDQGLYRNDYNFYCQKVPIYFIYMIKTDRDDIILIPETPLILEALITGKP
jgi:hypothetical protein